ncbi:AAA family ATPase [Pedobacter agri]|uniref:AAA family ATPase n=1 Tax=Pedobacter agri TaxID=454586 RepID=A0A9X3DDA3_9SPHI|nr:AAA family ATPase [Pedobacter agri]MCX3263718.1 AAA family ATPase [Pedobacter agri]
MSRIKIQNFGPIRKGFLSETDKGEELGWININKVTVLIGAQGAGKSTVAKLISTLAWIEKALMRGEISLEHIYRQGWFRERCAYQNIQQYLKKSTYIAYQGAGLNFEYRYGKITIEAFDPEVFKSPKIMYVPAERNLTSAVKNLEDLKGLPSTLYTFAEEFTDAMSELTSSIDLPINDARIMYDSISETPILSGKGYRINLSEASSGFQSLVPLFVVTRYLMGSIQSRDDNHRNPLSIKISKKMRKEANEVLNNNKIAEGLKRIYLERLTSKYYYSLFFNIVEEPEQNLYPSSQRKVLNMLLEFNNMRADNVLVLTTHSPYIVNYLTLAVKAGEISDKYRNVFTDELRNDFEKIIPAGASISHNELTIYELSEETGIIRMLPNEYGIPSDDNWLNRELGNTNDLFSDLLLLQQKLSR